LHFLTDMMLSYCMSSCTSSHIWCYATSCRLALLRQSLGPITPIAFLEELKQLLKQWGKKTMKCCFAVVWNNAKWGTSKNIEFFAENPISCHGRLSSVYLVTYVRTYVCTYTYVRMDGWMDVWMLWYGMVWYGMVWYGVYNKPSSYWGTLIYGNPQWVPEMDPCHLASIRKSSALRRSNSCDFERLSTGIMRIFIYSTLW